jgi:MOSC domain-containing protein YiiM
MQWVSEVKCIEGVGLEGDRYTTKKGTYSNTHNLGKPGVFMRQVTLISHREIHQGNMELIRNGFARFSSQEFKPADTRRNLIVEGDIEMKSLVGKEFVFGNTWFRGFEECSPCVIPNKVSGKEGFQIGFKQFGGLRAEILNTEVIWIGAELFVKE